MYLINVGSAAKDATVGCALEPPQPPVSPFVGFAKVYGLIEKWALEKRDIKVYSPFIDVENLVELQNRSKNARSVHICTRRNQRPQVPWDRITHPNFHFYSLDESTFHCKFIAGVAQDAGEVELLKMSANLTKHHLCKDGDYNKDCYDLQRLGASHFYCQWWPRPPCLCMMCWSHREPE